MYFFSKVRQHQSCHRSSCKITAVAEKCVIEFATGFCSTAQHQQKEEEEEQQLETPEHTKSAAVAVACLIDNSPCAKANKSSPPSGLCPFYLSSALTLDQLSPWQTSPPLWLLCLLSAATRAPCFDLTGPVGNKYETTMTDVKYFLIELFVDSAKNVQM